MVIEKNCNKSNRKNGLNNKSEKNKKDNYSKRKNNSEILIFQNNLKKIKIFFLRAFE